MSKLIYKFIEGLEIPDSIKDNLFKERNNKQLEEFAKNIPDLKYPDTYILAGRLLIYVNIKLCPKNINDYVEILNHLLRPEIKQFMIENKEILDKVIDETYYQNFSKQNILSASAHTLYLLRLSSEDPPVETPCMCDMRQAIQFYHKEGIEKVLRCYNELQDQLYVHASPTRFNAGLIKNQMSSCFAAGTQILTFTPQRRVYKNIEDVQIGDEVITHNNRTCKVTQLHKNLLNERQMYRVIFYKSDEIKVTGNHRFYTYRKDGPKWVAVEDLTLNDYVASYDHTRGNKDMCFSDEDEDHFYRRLIVKEEIDDNPEFVYTLGVEEDHSYCAGDMIVENCFLITLGDNIEDILYTGVGDTGLISKHQGGIGLHLNNIRHSQIGNAGKSGGIMPFTETFDKNTKCVNQGTKRNGAASLFLNIWHIDVMEFIQARDNYTHNGVRFKSANTALFVSHLFIERVKQRGKWTVFCPAKARIGDEKLSGTYGPEFEDLYLRLEKEAPKQHQEFEDFCKEIDNIEAKLNSDQDVDEDYINQYHKMVAKRLKMRKRLIEHKVYDAYDMYKFICDMHVKSSHPFMVYRDTVNMKNNMINIGAIEGSNLCVAPETLILTDKGQIPIIDLVGKKVNVWNGKEFSLVEPKKTGKNQELIKVKLSDSSELECTKYHKFYIQTRYQQVKGEILNSKNVRIIEANNLEPGMKLVKCFYPIIDSGEELKDAYTNGFFTGDGTYNKSSEEERRCSYKSLPNKAYCKRHICYQEDDEFNENCQGICYSDKPQVALYHGKINLLEHLSYRSKGEVKDNRLNITLPTDLKEKYFVPINYDLKSKLDWLAGYADADGCVLRNEYNQAIQLTSINKEFMMKVKYMLQTCGCNPKISINAEERKTLLPDGKGGKKYYKTQKSYRMVISSFDTQILIASGFKTYRLDLKEEYVQRNATQFITIKKVIETERISDTYCFTESKRNVGIFNGVITGQCVEINEPSDENNIASCNLGHIPLKTYAIPPKTNNKVTVENLKEHFDFKKLKTGMMALVENINRVIDYNYYPLDERTSDKLTVTKQGKISRPNLANRPIGIGVSGLGECFALLKIPFDSDLAKYLNKMIFAAMYYYGLLSSLELVKKYGHHYDSFKTGECKFFKDNEWKTLKGSPLSNGLFQFDLWSSEADYLKSVNRLDEKIYDLKDNDVIEPSVWGEDGSWEKLKEKIMKDGVMNSMILAPMPTASTSQLVRSTEAFEAPQNLIYSRKLVHGNFTVYSEPFVEDMLRLGLWTKELIEFVTMENGSIRYIDHFVRDNPQYFKVKFEDIKDELVEMKKIHRGMYEISQKDIMQMARQRGIYVDQSQSLNIYIAEPTIEKMMGVHMYGSALRLKTGMYYLRQNPASQTDRFTVDIPIKEYHQNLLKKLKSKFYKFKVVNNEEVCLSCT